MNAKRSYGITLLEMLVVLSLSILFGVLLVQVLGPTMKTAGRHAHRMELQQSAWLTLRRISTDLNHASVAGWSYQSDSAATVLSVHRVQGLTALGDRVWEDHLRVYSWQAQEKKIWSRKWPPAPPALSVTVPLDRPLSLPADQLAFFVGSGPSNSRILADYVEEFSVSPAAPPASQPLQIHLKMVRDEGGMRGPQEFEITREVVTRN